MDQLRCRRRRRQVGNGNRQTRDSPERTPQKELLQKEKE